MILEKWECLVLYNSELWRQFLVVDVIVNLKFSFSPSSLCLPAFSPLIIYCCGISPWCLPEIILVLTDAKAFKSLSILELKWLRKSSIDPAFVIDELDRASINSALVFWLMYLFLTITGETNASENMLKWSERARCCFNENCCTAAIM